MNKGKFVVFSLFLYDLFMRQRSAAESIPSWAKQDMLLVHNLIFPTGHDNHWRLVIVANVDSCFHSPNNNIFQDHRDKKLFLLSCDSLYSEGIRYINAVREFLKMVRQLLSTETEVDPEEQIEVRIGKQVAQEVSISCGFYFFLNIFLFSKENWSQLQIPIPTHLENLLSFSSDFCTTSNCSWICIRLNSHLIPKCYSSQRCYH